MDLKLSGRCALVTGSSSGIGEAIACMLAREGARVVLHGRRIAELKRVKDLIESDNGEASFVVGDLNDPAEIDAVATGASSVFGGVDILINNATHFPFGNWDETPISAWEEVYRTSVLAAVRLIELLTPHMRNNGWGRVITISSLVADCPPSVAAHYSAAKAASVAMTSSLAKSLAGTGVTANSVAPGLVRTPSAEPLMLHYARQRDWGSDWDTIEARMVEEVYINPSNRLGTPDDVALVVAMLASPLASFVNGTTVRVDGGANPTVCG